MSKEFGQNIQRPSDPLAVHDTFETFLVTGCFTDWRSLEPLGYVIPFDEVPSGRGKVLVMSRFHFLRCCALATTSISISLARSIVALSVAAIALGASEPGEGHPVSAAPLSDVPSIDPFLAIAKRNAFGIRPPPPPPSPEAFTPPPPPPSNLFLTGISVINGVRRAYLVQVEAAGKPPKYLTLDEAHGMQDGIRLLEIDSRKRVVRVQNGTEELALNFKDNAWKGNAGNPGNPGPANGGPPGMRQIPQQIGQAQAPAASSANSSGPTIIRRGGGIGRVDSGGANVGLDANGFNTPDAGNTREIPQRSSLYLGGSGTAVLSQPSQQSVQGVTPSPNQIVAPVFNPVAGSGGGAPVPPSFPPVRR